MPIYEYKCSSCGHQQEYLQKVSDPPPASCPACGRETFVKMLSAAGFQLKGSGWYATDFKGSGKKPAGGDAAKAEGAQADASKSEGAKGDGAKPEAKPASKKDAAGTPSATGGSPSGT